MFYQTETDIINSILKTNPYFNTGLGFYFKDAGYLRSFTSEKVISIEDNLGAYFFMLIDSDVNVRTFDNSVYSCSYPAELIAVVNSNILPLELATCLLSSFPVLKSINLIKEKIVKDLFSDLEEEEINTILSRIDNFTIISLKFEVTERILIDKDCICNPCKDDC